MHDEQLLADVPRISGRLLWPIPFGASLDAARVALSPIRLVATDQVHNTNISLVDAKSPELSRGADGLVTTAPSLALLAFGADCQILFAADSHAGVIGIAHAGWKGLVAGIGPTLIEAMTDQGAQPDHIQVHIGPSIGPCHYQVDAPEAMERFHQYFHQFGSGVAYVREGREVLDLRAAQRQLLLEAGIQPANLTIDPRCTYCAPGGLPSHRREGSSRSQTITGCMMIRDDDAPRQRVA